MSIRSTARRRAGRHVFAGLLLNVFLCAALQAADAAALTVEEFSGPVKLKMSDRWQDPAVGMTVTLPAVVSTGEEGSIELAQDGSVFSVGANTALELHTAPDSGELVKRVVQSKGSTFYDISNREHRKLRVETPYLAAVIKGTEFDVTVEPSRTSIALFEGLLHVEAPETGEAVELRAGYIARRAAGEPGITVIPMDGGEPVSGTRSGLGSGGDRSGDDARERAGAGDPVTPDGEGDTARTGVASRDSLLDDELGALIEPAESGAELDSARDYPKDPLALEAALGDDVGSIDAELDADLGSGELEADLGADASVGDLADAGVDAGLDADLGEGELEADLGTDASVGDLADTEVDAGLDADLGEGELEADLGADASVGDLADTEVDAGLDADLADGDVGVEADVGDVGLDAGLDEGGLDAGLDVGELDGSLVDDLLGGDDTDTSTDETDEQDGEETILPGPGDLLGL